MAGVVATAAMTAGAGAAPVSPSRLPPTQLAQVEQICRAVVGVPDGAVRQQDCIASLSASATALGRARASLAPRRGCVDSDRAIGAGAPRCGPSTAADHATPASAAAEVRINTAALEPTGTAYDLASRSEVRRRERAACARLGYGAGDASLATCVTNLNSALFAPERVMP